MTRFRIHRQLLRDSHRIGRFRFCHLLLHKNAALPWFILVPETQADDLLELPAGLRASALSEAGRVAAFIKQRLGYPKVNFAAIGNSVPQLHLHVVGRKPGDLCWPAPVWGNLAESADYSTAQLREITRQLVEQCGLKARR